MQNKKKNKRVQSIIVLGGLSAVVLIVSTYAWFIGRQEVGVNSFNVNIAAIENLEFSLNGTEWDKELDITNDTWVDFEAGNASSVYSGHTNSWGEGLTPVSSSGQIDTDASRLKLYEKSSFTRTAGGFKLLSEQIDNYSEGTDENGSYVAFDLFIKNNSGAEYYEAYDPTEEEEIFLTYNSSAVVDEAGSAESKASGVENSLRVAFMQIGRVSSEETDGSLIGGITCATGVDGVTPICKDNRSSIWEPNDTLHNAEALDWYTDNCRNRLADTTNLLDADSYGSDACSEFVADTAYVTNTIKAAIPVTESIDIYDGVNTFTANTTYVMPYDTFTDTEKLVEGSAREAFMFLAPNSITKVRVYIYLEGMDYDSQDYAEVTGTEITVNFGFTKQQYETSTDNTGSGSLDNGWDTEEPTPVAP